MVPFTPAGTGVALITPFSDNKIDFHALGRVIDHVINGGVEYLVSLGTTGETTSLTPEEQEQVLRFTLKHANERVPVVAGHFGGNHTAQLVDQLKKFEHQGVSAILSSSPAYVKPSQEGIYQHYMALQDSSPLPIIIYNVPSRTASNISAQTLLRLANASEKFIGVKDASGDLVQGAMISKSAPDHFMLLSGDDPTALPLISVGGQGVISVIANAFPRIFSDCVRLGLADNYGDALEAHHHLLDLHHWLYVEGNPVGIKEALGILGLITPELRLPLVRMSEQNLDHLRKEMDRLLL